jgi:hypothetical protein
MALDPDAHRLATGPNLATVVTVMPDGSLQALPTWIDSDGEHLLVNTEPQRQRARNVARDPRITVLILGANAQANLQRYMTTVNLSLDFLGPAPNGCWLEGRAQVPADAVERALVAGGRGRRKHAVAGASCDPPRVQHVNRRHSGPATPGGAESSFTILSKCCDFSPPASRTDGVSWSSSTACPPVWRSTSRGSPPCSAAARAATAAAAAWPSSPTVPT